jgi:hypothetical protein
MPDGDPTIVVAHSVRGIGPLLAKGDPMTFPSVDINPNTNGLPGIVALEKIVGALLTFGLIAAVAGVAISSIAWAVGSHSANPHVAGRGKSGVLVAGAAAMLIGAANTMITFFSAAGGAVR